MLYSVHSVVLPMCIEYVVCLSLRVARQVLSDALLYHPVLCPAGRCVSVSKFTVWKQLGTFPM